MSEAINVGEQTFEKVGHATSGTHAKSHGIPTGTVLAFG